MGFMDTSAGITEDAGLFVVALHDHLYHELNVNCGQDKHFLEGKSSVGNIRERDSWMPTVTFHICTMHCMTTFIMSRM